MRPWAAQLLVSDLGIPEKNRLEIIPCDPVWIIRPPQPNLNQKALCIMNKKTQSGTATIHSEKQAQAKPQKTAPSEGAVF